MTSISHEVVWQTWWKSTEYINISSTQIFSDKGLQTKQCATYFGANFPSDHLRLGHKQAITFLFILWDVIIHSCANFKNGLAHPLLRLEGSNGTLYVDCRYHGLALFCKHYIIALEINEGRWIMHSHYIRLLITRSKVKYYILLSTLCLPGWGTYYMT